jgi:hypothetical protein
MYTRRIAIVVAIIARYLNLKKFGYISWLAQCHKSTTIINVIVMFFCGFARFWLFKISASILSKYLEIEILTFTHAVA